jgi:RNA polymerase sigma factor (sigma-70 family)
VGALHHAVSPAAARRGPGDHERRLRPRLADALYGDLFGTTAQDGKRRSLLLYFHGRSSLSTWLRAVLAQRHIDVVRTRARQAPLDDDQQSSGDEPQNASPSRSAVAPHTSDSSTLRLVAQLQVALKAVLRGLEPGDRLRLASYYVQGMTLAQIGRMTGEHEATVSRKLDRLRRAIRAQVEERLERAGLSASARQECFDHARDEWPFDLSAVLASPEASGTQDCKVGPALRSKREDV